MAAINTWFHRGTETQVAAALLEDTQDKLPVNAAATDQ